MLNVQPEGRDHRLIGALLVLGVTALFFIVVAQLATVFFFFGDILLTFFLAWLLAFIISPVVTRVVDAVPRLPRAAAAVMVYTLVVVVMALTVVVAADALTTSIGQFVESIPGIRANLPTIVAPWQQWLTSIGLGQIDLVAQATAALSNLDQIAGALVEPLRQFAVASLGAVGTMLIVFFLSIYMVVDRDQIVAFLFRLVPPAYAEEAGLLQTSVSRSFGGFLRGQALMGIVYFLIALATNLLLGSATRGALLCDRRHAPGDPVLRAIRVVGAAGHRGPRPPARCALADPPAHGRGLDPGHERAPAADHAGRRGHPSDRRPGLGPDRLPDRRHPRGHLRDPDRSGRLRFLLPVPPSRVGRSHRRRTGGSPFGRPREAPGPHPARADAGQRRRHR
jgi:Predicted permease